MQVIKRVKMIKRELKKPKKKLTRTLPFSAPANCSAGETNLCRGANYWLMEPHVTTECHTPSVFTKSDMHTHTQTQTSTLAGDISWNTQSRNGQSLFILSFKIKIQIVKSNRSDKLSLISRGPESSAQRLRLWQNNESPLSSGRVLICIALQQQREQKRSRQ